jgi:hypothetical protein
MACDRKACRPVDRAPFDLFDFDPLFFKRSISIQVKAALSDFQIAGSGRNAGS